MKSNHTAYAFGKISKTMQQIVLADGDLTDRLEAGWSAGMAAITPSMMPDDDTRGIAEDICSYFRSGRFEGSTSEPPQIADRIWLLYEKLSRELR